MNRMHPEDLRTLVAAIQTLHPDSPATDAIAVMWADNLIAELAKTAAAPEPNERDCFQVALHGQMMHWKTRAEEAEGRAKELEGKLRMAAEIQQASINKIIELQQEVTADEALERMAKALDIYGTYQYSLVEDTDDAASPVLGPELLGILRKLAGL